MLAKICPHTPVTFVVKCLGHHYLKKVQHYLKQSETPWNKGFDQDEIQILFQCPKKDCVVANFAMSYLSNG